MASNIEHEGGFVVQSYFVTETVTYKFAASSVEEADAVVASIRENGIDYEDGMVFVRVPSSHMVYQLKLADNDVEKGW